MKIRHSVTGAIENVELPMTPMIDIVFNLLVFFIMTFNVVAQEGDFNVRMPLASITQGPPEPTAPPMTLRLTADQNGSLSGIYLNERPFANWDQLRQEIITLVGGQGGPSTADDLQVELDCDYQLAYENAIDAISHVSGYIDDSGNIVKLIENVQFSTKNLNGDPQARSASE